MAWQVTFTEDTEIAGEGTLTAANGDFSFSKRVKTDNATKVDEFVAAAKAKYATHQSKASSKQTIEQTVLTKLGA